MKKDEPFRNPSLDIETRLADLLSRLTTEEKIALVPTEQAGIERLGIKPYAIGAEGAHGFVDRSGPSTAFPQTIGLAATWDRALLRKIGRVIGTEARAWHNAHDSRGCLSLWFPTVDMEKDPRWGRTEEGYGEDPHLAGELASEIIRGAQGEDGRYVLASCAPKHFFANNNEKNRVSCSCSVDPRNMREYYLLPFRKAFLKGGARSLMTAYNEVNGVPLMLHPAVRDIVKGEWGLRGRGHVVTDGGDVGQTVNSHGYFESHAETVAAGFRNGADSMTDLPSLVIPATREALERGLIDERDLDEHVGNTLRLRFLFGHFDPPGECPYDALGPADMMTPGAAALAREASAASVVLLKNAPAPGVVHGEATDAPLLPLAKGSRVAVIGPLADVVHTDWYTGTPPYRVTPFQGLEAALGADAVTFESGRDEVSFLACDGRPLVLDADGVLSISSDPAKKPARFSRDDWGWGANTLRSLETGNYLDAVPDLDASRQPADGEVAAMTERKAPSPVRATARTTLNWFITTLFNIIPDDSIPPGDGYRRVYLRAWNGAALVRGAADGPVGLTRDVERASPFLMKLERSGAEAVARLAAASDTVVAFLGSNPVVNGKEEMDRPDLSLPPAQKALVEAAYGANPRVALALLSGYPYALDGAALEVPAILWAAHGMQEGGNGLADVLTGAVHPAGKLPMTWYRSAADLPPMMEYDVISSGATYRHFGKPPLFPFGHGLTYCRFEWSCLEADSGLEAGKPFRVSFKLKNAGNAPAEEVAQLYASFIGSRVKRPLKALGGFERVRLEPGECRRITLELDRECLEIWDASRERYCLEWGSCLLMVGPSSADARLSATVPVLGEIIPPRRLDRLTAAWNYDGYRNCHLHERRGSDLPAVFSGAAPGLAAGYGAEPAASRGPVAPDADLAWIAFHNADFGAGAGELSAQVSARSSMSGAPAIEARLDSPQGTLAGRLELPVTGDNCAVPGKPLRALWTGVRFPLEGVSGIHDLYLVLKGDVAIQTFSLR